jgi:hypothetical protein
MLRLRHGSSDDADTFLFRTRVRGAIATVGASVGCDWTVRAAGVPSVAFAMREDDGLLSLCPAPDASVVVDGRRMLPLWRSLPVGSRVDVGLLRIDVVAADGLAPEQSDRFPTLKLRRPAVATSILGAVEAADELRLPLRFPWAIMAGVCACAVLYAFVLRLLD